MRVYPTIGTISQIATRDHDLLAGLADDDHAQYHNDARHDLTARHTLNTVIPGGTPGEGVIILWPWTYATIVQGTWVVTINSTFLYCGRWDNAASSGNGDGYTHSAFLAAGTYKVQVLVNTAANAGKLEVKIDGAQVALLDTYSAGTVPNVVLSQAGVAVASAGLKTITIDANGKNGSSSAYNLFIQAIILTRTA